MHESPPLGRINTLSLLKISSGSMEAIKWLGLLTMTIDHINWFFFGTAIYPAYFIGRLALPLFAFIFAYNLAQPDALLRGLYSRVLQRLIFYGLLATPGYIAMRHLPFLFPLNIMFTLGIATACLYLLELGGTNQRIFAVFIFLFGGFFVDYEWIGLLFCISSWFFCKKNSLSSFLIWCLAYLLLGIGNGNNWALLTIPLLFLATKINLPIPRIRHFFYLYYPLHLTVFALIRFFA